MTFVSASRTSEVSGPSRGGLMDIKSHVTDARKRVIHVSDPSRGR